MPRKDKNRVWGLILTPEEEALLKAIKESSRQPLRGDRVLLMFGKDQWLLRLIERLKPLAELGEVVREGGKLGHETFHGSMPEKKQRWAEYQAAIDQLHQANPEQSYTDLAKKVASRFAVSPRTVLRRTEAPKKKL